ADLLIRIFYSYQKKYVARVIPLVKLGVLIIVLLQRLKTGLCGIQMIQNGQSINFNWAKFEHICILDFICILGIGIGTYFGYKIGKRALANKDARYVPFLKIGVALSVLMKSTKFRGADLTGVNFTGADLKNTDFRNYKTSKKIQKNRYLMNVDITGVTKMIGTHWDGVKNLHYARLQGTYLQYPQVRDLFNQKDIEEDKKDNEEYQITDEFKNFDNLDLQGINLSGIELQGASFIDTNLQDALLQKTDLSKAKLVRTLLDKADLSEAILTDAIIEDWGITSDTTFKFADIKEGNLEKDNSVYIYLYLAKKKQLQEKQLREKIQNQEDVKKLIDKAEQRWREIHGYFDELSDLKNTVLREHWENEFIKAAKQCKIPLPIYRQLFEDYCNRELLAQSHKDSWNVNLQRAEIRVEWLNRLLTQMDLFPILDHLGRLSILVAVIFFILDIPERTEISEREKAEAHYQAWEAIRDSKDDRASSGRRIALERLNKDGQPLAGLEAPKAILSGINLNDADLTDANFQEANLSNAKLNSADLSKADFSGANLLGADLRNAKTVETAKFTKAIYDPKKVHLLFEVNLKVKDNGKYKQTNQKKDKECGDTNPDIHQEYKAIGMIPIGHCADLRQANLKGWDLREQDLTAAKFQGADLRGTNLQNTKLNQAEFERTLYNEKTQFPNKAEYFNKKILESNKLYKIAPGADLKDANLTGVNLTNEDLNGADLRDADLRDANLEEAKLKSADLRNAKLTGANLKGANLKGALYNDATKFPKDDEIEGKGAYRIGPGADLRNAILTGANLEGANLKDALYNDGTKFPEKYEIKGKGAYRIEPGEDNDLTEANLKNQDLSGVNLSKADLSKADLSGADLSGADLSGAILSRADLIGADLSETNLSGANLIRADLSQAKNLTVEQIQKATNWKAAIYDDSFRKKLGLSPKKE
ncbi:pentapeptide repeat-containing protein, partial [Calothrix rhizosoleniae]|uniref:pentapeptide repeat-containing protein n=1 Tax=Calothrix rhizosoleniae TaxID=888997 RepID=UPI001F28996F